MAADAARLIEAEIEHATEGELVWYLVGAAHDATVSELHNTTRFCQSGREWIDVLASVLDRLGNRAWIYKEGADRNCWVVETTWPSEEIELDFDPAAYARGYFDAEGGIPLDLSARVYIRFVQKNLGDLALVKACLEDLGLVCGSIHNPSVRVDPNYWRFYVLSESRSHFLHTVGAWHPRKRGLLEARFARTGS